MRMSEFWKALFANWLLEMILFQVENSKSSNLRKSFGCKVKLVWFADKHFGIYEYTCAPRWWKDDADLIHMPHFHM